MIGFKAQGVPPKGLQEGKILKIDTVSQNKLNTIREIFINCKDLVLGS